MKLLATCFLLLIGCLAQAQTPPNSETAMQQWIAALDTTWQETFAREVTTPFEAEVAKATQQYTAALEANLARARGAGDLDQTLLWQTERDRFAAGKAMPAEDEATAAPTLKQARAGWRTQVARLEKERGERAKAVQTRYDQVLAQAQKQLTQQARIDDALMVKKKREEIAAGRTPPWLAANQPPAPVAPPGPAAQPAKLPLKAQIADLLTGQHWIHLGKFEYEFTRDGRYTLLKTDRTGKYEIDETKGFVSFTWDNGRPRGEGVQFEPETLTFKHNRGGTFLPAAK
jgi:hypothetical protein